MMRFLIGFAFSLFFLLLGGYAYTYQACISCSPEKVVQRSIQDELSSVQHYNVQIRKAPASNKRKIDDKIKAEEIEDDDESESFKKYSKISTCCITFFSARAPEYIYLYNNNRLPFCDHFSWSSSDKFIIHRVIRI